MLKIMIVMVIAGIIMFAGCGKKEEKREMTVEDPEKIIEVKKAPDETEVKLKPIVDENYGITISCLKKFNGMCETFKKNDYDWNGKKDYPTSIAILYYGVNSVGEKIMLIEEAEAHADYLTKGKISIKYKDSWDNNKEKTIEVTWNQEPRSNYWFAVIPKMADGTPFADKTETNYGICAFPAEYDKEKGVKTFIISEEGTVYEKDLGSGKPVEQWPAEDPSTKGWKISD